MIKSDRSSSSSSPSRRQLMSVSTRGNASNSASVPDMPRMKPRTGRRSLSSSEPVHLGQAKPRTFEPPREHARKVKGTGAQKGPAQSESQTESRRKYRRPDIVPPLRLEALARQQQYVTANTPQVRGVAGLREFFADFPPPRGWQHWTPLIRLLAQALRLPAKDHSAFLHGVQRIYHASGSWAIAALRHVRQQTTIWMDDRGGRLQWRAFAKDLLRCLYHLDEEARGEVMPPLIRTNYFNSVYRFVRANAGLADRVEEIALS